ncbi:MAG: Eco57I restriction-modification methylase domain-containing protein [Phycisphaerae bacterium]
MSRTPPTHPSGPPKAILQLVQRFAQHHETYKRQVYNETQVRREFIDPLFTALGWDVDNRAGHAEAYKDVIHEDAIKIGGSTKAPDYCFRIGGVRKFFVEAKKPAVPVKDDPGPAYQLRRYGWTAKLPLAIVTDFEEFAVYDCRIRPRPTDKPTSARVKYITYDQYADRWGGIAAIFSKEAILQGSFDKYAESNRRKRGTAEVDTEFLKEIERWRELLARNIALRNPGLSVRDLNYAVSKTIDRLIFLRMCEDRGVETYAQLRILLGGAKVYDRLQTIFRSADERYNSGLFYFQQEKNRTDYIVKHTVGKLLKDKAPADVGPMLDQRQQSRKRKRPVPTVRVLDPACGSGSFLLGAYQYLLDWHLRWYADNDPHTWAKKNPPIYQVGAPDPSRADPSRADPSRARQEAASWRLTVAERKRILLNNLFGVDIDPQAVEVTKLSLLLKVLEGESQQTLENQLRLFHERALPDLGGNIKCGNSLIGPDFYDNEQMTLLDDEERYRINVFDWEAEFPEVFDRSPKRKRGVITPSGKQPQPVAHAPGSDPAPSSGFDAVIGNPPYIRVRHFKDIHPEQADYLETQYTCATHVWDIYLLIFERALSVCRTSGRCGFIVPIQTLHQPNCASLRRILYHGACPIASWRFCGDS